jgi:hypothetical protein
MASAKSAGRPKSYLRGLRTISGAPAPVKTGASPDANHKMQIQNANELQVSRLFHYQSFKPDWLRQIIFDHKIYFSNPANFNDPWDCRPMFRIPTPDDPETYEQLIQWLARAFRQRSPQVDEDDVARRITKLRKDPSLIESMMAQLSELITGVLHKEYRLYCLSTKSDSTLMWAHYSNNHTGVCLEFACNNIVFGGALEVQYSERYPLYDVTDSTIQSGLLPLCSKSNAWSYENEYRVIAQEKPGVFPRLRTRNSFLKYPGGALRGVIMGCMMSPSDADELRRIFDQQFPRGVVELKRAVRTPNRYSLSIERC